MTETTSHPSGSSANWDRVDQILFSWLDQPEDQIEQRLAALRVTDPTLAQAMESRLGRLHRLGHLRAEFAQETGPRVGATFGDYRVVRALGQGGMGAVYLAEQQSLKRRVALKVIRGEKLRDPGARDRFRREARAVADLRHPGICGVLDVGEVDNTPFLAMQYIDGETLAERLAAQRAGNPTSHETRAPSTAAAIGSVLELVEQVARSLHAAHEAGVVHRDVKPGNVMIDRAGQPVVLDFGLAHVDPAAGDPTLTRSGDLLGTPAYMSPEQVRPKGRTIDRRTDVYSLGVTLFECLTLERPFSGSTHVDLYERIVQDPTPDPRRSNPHLPADVSAVVARAMEKEPARRYATAADFADELARLRRHEPVRARQVGVGGRCWRWAQRNPRAAVLMAGLAVALGAASALLWLTVLQREEIRGVAEVAKTAATRAEEAQGRESKRAAELEQVALFQDARLRDIDPQTMGVRMRRRLLTEARKAMERTRRSPEEVDARVAELEERIAGTSFTDVALATLRENVFDQTLRAIDTGFAQQPVVHARLLQASACTLRRLGLRDMAEEPQRQAYVLAQQALGDNDERTLTSQSDLALLLAGKGRSEEAETLMIDCMQRTQRQLGENNRDTIITMANLGALWMEQDRLEEAEPLLRTALDRARGLEGDSKALETANHSLGQLLRRRGDLAAAEPRYREALDLAVKARGEDDPESMEARNGLGIVLMDLGRIPEAEPVLTDNLARWERVFGDDHPGTLAAQHNWADLLYRLGRNAEAERYARRAVKGQERIYGPDHPLTATAIDLLGVTLHRQGRFAEALPYQRRALDTFRQASDTHPDTLIARINLAATLRQLGQLDEAETVLRPAVTGIAGRFGGSSRIALAAMSQLGGLLHAQGKLEDAERLFRRMEERTRDQVGGADARPAALNGLGNVLLARGDPAGAEPFCREAVELARASHGSILLHLQLHALVLYRLKKLGEAEKLYREELPIWCETPDGPDAVGIGHLAQLLIDQVRLDDAETTIAHALDLRRRALDYAGKEDQSVAGLLAILGRIQLVQKRPANAAASLQSSVALYRALAPGSWQHHEAMMLLGSALDEQGQHDAAERLLVDAATKMQPPKANAACKREALERLIKHYEDWGKPEDAAPYRKELMEVEATGTSK